MKATLRLLQRVYGVGPGIAAMTVRILIDEGQYGPPSGQLGDIDVKADSQLWKVFHRAGLAAAPDEKTCVEAARALYPEFPAKLDWPAWEIGRKHCHESAPACRQCPIGSVCPKIGT